MTVTLNKKQIAGILGFASAILPRKPSVPALACALFEPDGEQAVRVTVTDLEQTLRLRVEPEHVAGRLESFLFPVAELRKLKSDSVTLRAAGEDAVVCTARTGGHPLSRTVAVPPASEFPELPDLPDEMTPCDVGAFLRAYRGAAFAAHADASRLALHGVFAHAEESALVATDGHRLTRRVLESFPLPGDTILPLNRMLLKSLPEDEAGRIGLHERDDDRTLVLATGDVTYSCRCLDGTYPNYRDVMPDTQDFASSLRFGPGDVESVRSLVPFLDKAQDHMLCLFGRNGRALVATENGENTTVLPLAECRCEGEGLGICLDGALLLEALDHGFLSMRVRDTRTPLAFDDDSGGLHLLMPLHAEPSDAVRDAADAHLGKAIDPAAVEPPTVPQPTTPQETNPMPTPQTAAPAVPQPTRNMQFVQDDDIADPVARLEELVNETQELAKQANASVREVRRQLRAVKTHFRDREKQIEAREKEMERSRGLIQRLQEAIAA